MQTFHPMGRSEKLEQRGRKLMMGTGCWQRKGGAHVLRSSGGESSGLVQKLNSEGKEKEGRKVILSLQSLGAGRRYGTDVG